MPVNVTLPVIHLNGTSAKTLMAEVQAAHEAICTARAALCAMTVHQRDHYVKHDKQSFEFAQREHVARIRKLDEIKAELEAIWAGIFEQDK